MRLFLLFLIVIHGLIHLLGFVKAFNLAEVDQLHGNISGPVGVVWLLTVFLFMVTAVFYYLEADSWWMTGGAAVILSQVLIFLSWSDAKYGTLANLILVIPVVIAFVNELPTSYENRFKVTAEQGLSSYTPQELLTMEDLAHLPQPVQRYIRNSGSIGKEKVHNFRAVFSGQIKPKPDGDFLKMEAVQYNFFDDPTRAFYIESTMFGLPLEGLHLYVGSDAIMQIKVASLLQVVDARGPVMNKSETVTLFNDMCFLAPATLIDEDIEWETIDSTTVRAIFTNRENTISATLYFNEKGELVNFASDDRAESADGKEYKNYRWTTPLGNYKTFGNGRTLASYGEAYWHKPDGPSCYGKFTLVDIEYNLNTYRE